MTVTVRPALAADVPAAAAVLAEAFRDDPMIHAFVPEGRRDHANLTDFFTVTLRSGAGASGIIDLAEGADGALLGVAAWEGPERGLEKLHQLRHIGGYLRTLGVRGLARAIRLSAAVGHLRPHEPHWYLATIGVSGSARGLGVGSALLESRLAVLDATQQTAYLESSAPANRRLYVRHGFEQTTTLAELTGTEAVGMRRDPRA